MRIFSVPLFCFFHLFTLQTIGYSQQARKSELIRPEYQKLGTIPIGGNSWVINPTHDYPEIITSAGIVNWNNSADQIATYFRTGITGTVQLAIRARALTGKSKIRCQLDHRSKVISIDNPLFDTIKIGTFNIEKEGYQKLIFTGITKTSACFAEISDLIISGQGMANQIQCVKDEFYWGRRGPSVHLNYRIPPESGDIMWFYNELTIPEGYDVPGSYFMANGFAEGYFGIQVNSSSERRILFSVWSPFKTDKPEEIPEDQKITLLKKGEDVHAGSFGNEGSGGQSYRKYNWKPATTYCFLLKGTPSEHNSTDYTAYFYAPETSHWELIASFRRPNTTTYLKHLHSFLENFIPVTGYLPRMGIYSNQWVCNSLGQWAELTEARFTADATARKKARLDYAGGSENGAFFLKNCGFFNGTTEINNSFTRPKTIKAPPIDFSILP
jgi:hypothetical protein